MSFNNPHLSHQEPFEVDPFLNSCMERYGLSLGGWNKLATPLTYEHYQNWIENGCHGEMSYLERHSPFKQNPQSRYPFMRSYISLAQSYFPQPPDSERFKKPNSDLRIALYAQGEDYHQWFQEKLKKICDELSERFRGEIFLPATDSQPLLERDMAYRAGLGWFGKNSCLIHPKKGSLFFLGEILTSLDIEISQTPVPDFCGTCTKCLDICPTQALSVPKKLDARKCISYWTIESKSIPPLELRDKISDHFFGCDLCQTVCPWNERLFKGRLETRKIREYSREDRLRLIEFFRKLLSSSDQEIKDQWDLSPLLRAKGFGLKRNALIIIGNLKLHELSEDLEKLQDPRLEELKGWTKKKLDA